MVEKNNQTAYKKRTFMPIVLKKVLGFLVFIIVLLVANYLVGFINNSVYNDILMFFNMNITLFLMIFFVDAIQEIFWNFRFPFNLPAPILSSVLGVLDVIFFVRLWEFINNYTQINLTINATLISIFLVLVILVVGYSRIIINLVFNKQTKSRINKNMRKLKKYNFIIYARTWKEVGEQFESFFHNFVGYLKELLYNIGEGLQKMSSGSKKNKKRK